MTAPVADRTPPPLPAAATNTPGRVALGCGIGAVVVGMLTQVFSVAVVPRLMVEMSLPPNELWKFYAPFQLAIALLSLLALAFGAAGLGRSGPRLAAAAGTAIGATTMTQLTFGLIAPVVFAFSI